MSKVRESSPQKQIRKNNVWGGYSRKSEYYQQEVLEDDKPISVRIQPSSSYRKPQLSHSLLQEQDFNLITSKKPPFTSTYSKKDNPKHHKDTPPNQFPSSNSRVLINSSDSRFAIQSQPNQLTIDRSLYFNGQQTNYMSIVKNKQTDKEISAFKLIRLLCKLGSAMYIKKLAFINIKNNLQQYKKSCTNQEQIQKSQLDLINKLIEKVNQPHSHGKFYEVKIDKVKIPYYNKLVGLCNPFLIKKQKLINSSNNNISQIKKEKESTYLHQTPKNEKSFIFNFQITPKPPVNNEKRITKSSYSGTTKSRSKIS